MAKKKKPTKEQQSKLIVPGAESKPKTQLLVPETEVGKTTARLNVPEVEVGKKSTLLIGSDDEQPAAKPTLLVDGAPLKLGEEVAEVAEEAADQFTVINEDTGESVVEEADPVRITAMVPPTAQPAPEPEPEVAIEAAAAEPVEDVIEPVVAVAMAAPAALLGDEEAAPVEDGIPAQEENVETVPQPEYAEAQPEYAEAQPEYAEAQPEYAEEAYQAEPVVAQPAYEEAQPDAYAQPAYYDQGQQGQVPPPAPVAPPPSFSPPPPAPPHSYPHPQPAPQQPYGYGPPPMGGGYPPQQMPGQMYSGAGYAPQRNVPGWALVLVGVLTGFLLAMMIFKFTGMGAALRNDLVTETRKEEKAKYKKLLAAHGIGVEEEEEEEEEPEEEKPEDEQEDPVEEGTENE